MTNSEQRTANSEQRELNSTPVLLSRKKLYKQINHNKASSSETLISQYVVNVPLYGTAIALQSIQAQNNNSSKSQNCDIEYHCADISENKIREQMPDVLDILLIDRTTSTAKKPKNIIWANENYLKHGQDYAAIAQIKPVLITGQMGHIIMPRALKSSELQKQRTKSKAEVFTPLWMVKKQNDVVEHNYLNDDLETYIKRTWLEITCGEAPYMATRYDMETGEMIELAERVGFVDRKLQRIHTRVDDKAEWQRLVEEAYKASYGFEWNGDSLLLARENLLYTYQDYYVAKWKEQPTNGLLKEISEIISYNVFQMDGLKYIIPLTEKLEKIMTTQMTLFDEEDPKQQWIVRLGKRVKIMNWDTKKMEFFDKGVK